MITTGSLSIDRYLEACIQIEEIAAKIYRRWSQTPSLDRARRDLWCKMEQEELLHIEMLEQLRYSVSIGEIRVPMQTDDQIFKMAEYVRSCQLRIRLSHYPSSVALFLVIRMKERCAHFYATQSLALLDKRIDQTFQRFSRDDKEQSRQLRKVYDDSCQAETVPAGCQLWQTRLAAG